MREKQNILTLKSLRYLLKPNVACLFKNTKIYNKLEITSFAAIFNLL